jgi:hypothetical protein
LLGTWTRGRFLLTWWKPSGSVRGWAEHLTQIILAGVYLVLKVTVLAEGQTGIIVEIHEMKSSILWWLSVKGYDGSCVPVLCFFVWLGKSSRDPNYPTFFLRPFAQGLHLEKQSAG